MFAGETLQVTEKQLPFGNKMIMAKVSLNVKQSGDDSLLMKQAWHESPTDGVRDCK